MKERARLWVLDHLPNGVKYQPAEWALSLLLMFAGITNILGVRTSSAIEVLPTPVYYAWAGMLVIGGATLAVGLASTRRAGDNYVVTRVPAYRLGLRLIGATEVVYILVLCFSTAGAGAIQASIGPMVVAILCGVRLLTIGGRQ
jgi:hypothetical protein